MGSAWSSPAQNLEETNHLSHLFKQDMEDDIQNDKAPESFPEDSNKSQSEASTASKTTSTPSSDPDPDPTPATIAIIGGGIIGLITALGLLDRGITATVYERAPKPTETSAGFTFSASARKAMSAVSPRVLSAFLRVAAPNEHPFIRYFDGYTPGEHEAWAIPAERPDYYGCLRAAFLESLGKEMPEGAVRFGKSLAGYQEIDGKVTLVFGDGGVEVVDAVIGCDGIKSRTRQLLLGQDHPAAHPGFTGVVAYRAVLPLEGVVRALGSDKGLSHCLHVGPGAYTVTYPVAHSPLTNMILFCKTGRPWTDSTKHLQLCQRSTAQEAVQDWKSDVRGVVDLLPETPNKWAIFDTAEHPAPSYVSASGRVCIAGDAAHASTPFLASGAAMGVEDAAVLGGVLGAALGAVRGGGKGMGEAIRAALRTYSDVRMERSQRVVRDSRAVGEVCMWQDPETGRDAKKCFEYVWTCMTRVWEFDIVETVERARGECLRMLGEMED
ncbi:FAD-dependent oxidoreductase [Aspergillus mulundensis]|uniref:FAD-binding domain-containing protein n=1 Tax=Aspergillus mulundensis TaxID=1810919 RepID=A0A3D8SKY7_9EURO|nr:Uncharacterized protein DSM5745_03629 [Aspergillus mulundensis]RDW86987.1 Uncharacterized protein DSM5745_03629 [Aspergillus mulundensis]